MRNAPSQTRAERKPVTDRFSPFVVLCLSLGYFGTAHSQHGLTEQDVLARVLKRAEITAVLARPLEASRAELRAARLWPNPSLELSVQDVERAAGDAREDSFWLRQEFDVSGGRGLKIRAAQARVSAGEADSAWRRRELIAEVRARFFRVLARQSRVETTRRWLAQLEEAGGVVAAREQAGESSGYERLRLARERDRARAIIQTEQAEREGAWQQLVALIGSEESDSATDSSASQVVGHLLPDVLRPLGGVLANLSDRPDLQALAREVEASEHELAAAERAWVPALELGVGRIEIDDSDGDDTGILLNARIGLPFSDRGQAAKARLRARLGGARAEYSLAVDQARSDITAAHVRARRLTEAAREMAGVGSQDSTQLLRVGRAAYRGGELSLLELLDVYETVYGYELRVLELQAQARAAQIELDRLKPEESL